ncbi:hypothetical protein [Nocardioides zeicaulis]|uniref:DUF5666 domain-containing protein n=3 Tax=Nocardioides zeicaulis TaxID=1776857 RepID=A0ABV6DXU2_9ACTN
MQLRHSAIALATLALLVPAQAAHARGGDDGGSDDNGGGAGTTTSAGHYAVTIGTRTYEVAAGRDLKLKDLAVTGPIRVSGVHTSFVIDPATLGVVDYTLTGAPSPERMVTSPTVVFASKTPVLTPAQLRSPVLRQLEVKDASLTAILGTAAGKLKIQAKDAPQGGIFQMEPEFGTNVELVHTLGPGLFYFVNAFTGKINFGNGTDAVTSGPDAHQMLLGKDSPQVATKLFQDGRTTRWSVTSGGRLGGVLGEDAIELSQGATSCTSQCQAQNQVRGSLPVPPDPTNPTPLPVRSARGDADRVERTGSCAGGARWSIKAKEDDGRIEVEAEVDSRAGQQWSWQLQHDGSRVASGTARTAGRSGSFSVERKVADGAGTDAFVFRATRPGQRCVARLVR